MGFIYLICAMVFLSMGGFACYVVALDGRYGVLAFTSIFVLVGIWLLSQSIKIFMRERLDKAVVENGRAIPATIVGHTEGRLTVNGAPSVAVVLEYVPVGQFEPVHEEYETDKFDSTPWPIGSTVIVRYYDGHYAWDKEPVLSEAELKEKRGPRFL